jgi:hypothetical protein
MTGFVRKALTVAAGLALVATTATAGVPDPAQSQADDVIVGNVSGNPLSPGGAFGTAVDGIGYTVVVNDVNGSPVSGVQVTINLSTGSGSTGLSAGTNTMTTQVAPATVDCASSTITKVTDGSGVAIFTGLFGGAENSASIEVRADGILLKLIQARSTDMNADGETGLADLNEFRKNFFGISGGNTAALETDFDIGGDTGLGDLNKFRIEFFDTTVITAC